MSIQGTRRFLILSVLVGIFAARANASDFRSPRTAALGGSGHAGPLLNDAIYLNPSFVSFVPAFGLGVSYGWYGGDGPDNQAFGGKLINVSLLDGRNEFFQAAVGYTRRRERQFIHLGAARRITPQIGFGIAAKLVYPTVPGGGTARDFTVSTTALASDWFQSVIVVDNLLANDASQAQGLQREFILGTKFNLRGLCLIYWDPHWIQQPQGGLEYGFEWGTEFVVLQDLFLRGGFFQNSTSPTLEKRGGGYGFGAGWLAPRLSLDYAFSKTETPESTYTHQLGFTVFY